MLNWHTDFKWSIRGVTVKDTGAFVPFNISLLKDLWVWLPYYCVERCLRFGKKSEFTITYTPKKGRPWYLLPITLLRAGGKSTRQRQADLAIYFFDKTIQEKPSTPSANHYFNFECLDISKSKVAKVFEEVFGYNLAVDPAKFTGHMVCKSEHNGAHDGHIITGPVTPREGWVYQRVINNATNDGTVADLRCPTVRGRIPLIFIKERPIDQRFANFNSRCRLSTPEAHFSAKELDLLSQFCKKMKLDWGGLDVLRDKETNRLYIVDVNKTDMGPPLALPMKDKLKSTDILAHAVRDIILGKTS